MKINSILKKWLNGELNSGPRPYESRALPLSYGAKNTT